MVLVIAVVGNSGSGKTTTIEHLISRFSEDGFRVGSIKRIHHPDFSIDTTGKDTWRHTRAGAKVTVSLAPKEIAIIKKTDTDLYERARDLDEIISLIDREKLDIIFLEGLHSLVAKRRDVPKIITAKNSEDLERTLNGTAPPIVAVTGLIAENKLKIHDLKVPIINLHNEGDLLFKLVKNCVVNQFRK